MRARGINYDTGFLPGQDLSRKTFTPETVRHEMAVISGDLHCDAVRISGRDPERLSIAARYAADAGLEVWFAPFPVDLPAEQLLPFFADCARRAEDLRRTGAEVVFVTGCEISAYRGAGERGGMAWQVPQGAVPDEDEQVRYLTELLDIFEEEGVDTALWFTFAGYTRPEDQGKPKKVFLRWRPDTNAAEAPRRAPLASQPRRTNLRPSPEELTSETTNQPRTGCRSRTANSHRHPGEPHPSRCLRDAFRARRSSSPRSAGRGRQ